MMFTDKKNYKSSKYLETTILLLLDLLRKVQLRYRHQTVTWDGHHPNSHLPVYQERYNEKKVLKQKTAGSLPIWLFELHFSETADRAQVNDSNSLLGSNRNYTQWHNICT